MTLTLLDIFTWWINAPIWAALPATVAIGLIGMGIALIVNVIFTIITERFTKP